MRSNKQSIFTGDVYKTNNCGDCTVVDYVHAKKILVRFSDTVVESAKRVHGERYTYFLSDYKNRNTKIRMLCAECGITFRQTPEKHLTGQGCSVCNKAGFDTSKTGVLYVLSCDGLTKIGITNKNAPHRVKEINRSTDNIFSVVKEYPMSGELCAYIESTFLAMLRKEYNNPPVKFDGYTECFVGLSEDDLVEMLDCVT